MMEEKEVNPSIIQFKQFITTRPHLIKEVRNEETSWQSLYEDWVLLGEDDPRFEVKDEGKEKQNDSMKWVSELMGKVDQQNFERIMIQISEIISAVQGMLSNVQKPSQQTKTAEPKKHPFSLFYKD